jgi:hypothetical protein
MERAEDLVERLGQRLGHFTALAGFQIQKATARRREEIEDMWAEDWVKLPILSRRSRRRNGVPVSAPFALSRTPWSALKRRA